MSLPPFAKPEIAPGTLIDTRYIIQTMLGQGGLGRTYLALDTRRFNEACVLKEFAPIGTGDDGLVQCRNLFKREAKILHGLEHPQIPRFLACFEGEDRLFLVQEYVNGNTYSQLLQERQKRGETFFETEIIFWLQKLLPVLQYVHQHQVIHRDISPDNIMLPTGKDLPVLIDFGVGKQLAELKEATKVSHAAFVGKMSLVGKVGYAPREQISLGLCSPSSDLYALGVTAVVLLTGRDPSFLMDRYSLEWNWRMYAHVSDNFAQILDKMLADTPKARYQKTEEVIADLQQFGRSRPSAPHTFDVPPTLSTTESRKIRTVRPSQPTPQNFSQPHPIHQQVSFLDTSFITKCQEALAYYIGPMANLVIEDVYTENPEATPSQFVELLAREIPDSQAAIEFARRVYT